MRLDSRTKYPTAMEEYLEMSGYHFNKRLCDFAVSMMRDRSGNKLQPWDKEKVESFMKANGVNVRNNIGHDLVYVLNMARSDYWGSSLADDLHLALYVADYLDDPDGTKTRAFDEFFINCIAKGIPIFWEEMI